MQVGGKSIVLSYAPRDRDAAIRLRGILAEYLGDELWLREFDLQGGDLLAEALDVAISNAKWFILLLSAEATKTPWIVRDARLATFRTLEDDDFRILVLKLDDSPLPKNLQGAVDEIDCIDLTAKNDLDAAFMEVADLIEKTESTRSTSIVYVDRGNDLDRFTLAARVNPIIFILGWPGIGKTAFATRSVSEKLNKHPIADKLTSGHSADLLARQVLARTHVRQPLADEKLNDQEWIRRAVDALKARQDKFFLFLDNGQEALNAGTNELLPYVEDFLKACLEQSVQTHVVIATTRNPDYSPEIAKSADVIRLDGMGDPYITECIDLWLQRTEIHDRLIKSPKMTALVELAGGHPLAAKLIASRLKAGRSSDSLLESKQKRRFRLKLAEYIIRSTSRELQDLHRLVLHILALVGEPLRVEDLMAVNELRKHGLERVQQACGDLDDWFLIQHEGELMYLHSFVGTYFRNELSKSQPLTERIAKDFGHYAFEKSAELYQELSQRLAQEANKDSDTIIKLSGHIFRYAIPAGRMLRYAGENELADKLPIQVKGLLREMVFFLYQQKRNYRAALEYADKWLQVNPQDLEILLYKLRCYRNIGDEKSLNTAQRMVERLQQKQYGEWFTVRLLRERGIISERLGNPEEAKHFFRQGIDFAPASRYPDNHVALAQLLLREAEDTPPGSEIHQELADEAVELLEVARDSSSIFDRINLETYVAALIEAGEDQAAFPLIAESLAENPDDPRLNYRMAEILRKREDFDEAKEYADRAFRNGAGKAALTMANILYGQALRLETAGHSQTAEEKLREALDSVARFEPEFGGDQEVADSIKGKLFRHLGDLASAWDAVKTYEDTANPFTVYERSRILLDQAKRSASQARYQLSLDGTRLVINSISAFGTRQKLPQPLRELLDEAASWLTQMEQILRNEEEDPQKGA